MNRLNDYQQKIEQDTKSPHHVVAATQRSEHQQLTHYQDAIISVS